LKTAKVQVASAEGGPSVTPGEVNTLYWIRVIAIDWVTGRSGRNGSKSLCVVFEAAALGSMYSHAAVSLYGELCSPWTVKVKSLISGTRGGALNQLASAWKGGHPRLHHYAVC